MKRTVPIFELKEKLEYNPDTGSIKWINTTQWTKAGEEAGASSHGYIVISVNKVIMPAHRIAWAMMHGEWPEKEIDHINGIRSDNRIKNLRHVTHNQNCFNSVKQKRNKSGLKGVSWHSAAKKWQVHIKAFGVRYYLGLFEDKEKAHEAYCSTAKKLHGEYAKHQ